MSLKISVLSVLLFLLACSPQKKGGKTDHAVGNNDIVPVFSLSPGVMVYKTKNDYRDKVPVVLSSDRRSIISYPHPKDLFSDGKLAMPDRLEGGYLLDNRGVQENTAFLSYTYEEYGSLSSPPSLQVMYGKILDKDPLTELCNCGDKSVYTDVKLQINQLIRKNMLRQSCKVIK
jgi:hypothetical protein